MRRLRAEKSKGRTVDRAKPSEPEISSAQAVAVSSLTVPTRVLGSIKRREAWKYRGEGSDRSRQSIRRVKSTRTPRELERAPRTLVLGVG